MHCIHSLLFLQRHLNTVSSHALFHPESVTSETTSAISVLKSALRVLEFFICDGGNRALDYRLAFTSSSWMVPVLSLEDRLCLLCLYAPYDPRTFLPVCLLSCLSSGWMAVCPPTCLSVWLPVICLLISLSFLHADLSASLV